MANSFFEDLNNENATGVAYKNLNLKKSILAYFANVSNGTIADLSKELNISVPKMTALLNDLIEDGIVCDFGKVESSNGRKPNLFGLLPESGFFIGVDIHRSFINIALSDLQKNLLKEPEKISYKFENKTESLDTLCELINTFIIGLSIPKDKILGIGVNISGRVNFATGYSYSFFYFSEEPLTKIIEAKVGIKVFLENDSRAMAFGEFSAGVVKDEKDVLFLNLDYGIGLGIMLNGHLHYGKSGYSGEFGHIPIFDNEILCHCGKKGCLETEASGWALIRMVQEKRLEGSSSVLFNDSNDNIEIKLEDIIQAAINDDVLAIDLIAKIGEKIGRGIAMLINLFNPELVIIGGSLSETEDYIRLPIKSAINKYSLSLVNNDTQLKMSLLKERAGVIGACLLVRNRLLS